MIGSRSTARCREPSLPNSSFSDLDEGCLPSSRCWPSLLVSSDRPIGGRLVTGRLGDMVGRKYAFLVAHPDHGSNHLRGEGVLPSFASPAYAAPS